MCGVPQLSIGAIIYSDSPNCFVQIRHRRGILWSKDARDKLCLLRFPIPHWKFVARLIFEIVAGCLN